jgi:hypothetical protein
MWKALSAIRRGCLRTNSDVPSWHLYLFLAVFIATLLAAFVLVRLLNADKAAA